MKKFYFFAMACIALASCVNDEPVENGLQQSNKAIVFNSPVMYGTSRAVGEIEPNYYPDEEHFSVFAMYSENQTTSWGGTNDVLWMDNVETAKDENGNSWSSDAVGGGTTYYWPKKGYLTFAAYSPTRVNQNGTLTYGANGLTITGYTTPGDGLQYDFMFSKRTFNQQGTNYSHTEGSTYEAVDITFQHALSAIRFKVATDTDYKPTTITINSIKILNAYSQADFNENVADGETYSHNAQWTELDIRNTSGYEVVNTAQALTTDLVEISDHNDILMIPQKMVDTTIDNSIKIEVNYTIKNVGGAEINQVYTVNLADTDGDGTADYLKDGQENTSNEIAQWEMGKRYTYNIKIGLNKIYFNPIVENWDDVTVSPELDI